ncbi:MAG: 6-phosphogluconolactonase [Sulfuricaulis sp.]|nr:6-phosphogluconolactonase [Sulfuricaulis sp.]
MSAQAPTTRWQVFLNGAALADQATALILEAARAAITTRGVFHLVLAGGNTPKDVYERLREVGANWAKWQIYFGDERCLPRGDPERNDTMARRAWLDHIRIPPVNIHPIPAEQGAEKGAQRYAEILRRVPEFDLVLLGLGEDGHTASLFPGHPEGLAKSDSDVIAVRAAPKPPPERVSLSAARLSRAQRVLYMVGGESKRDAVKAWRAQADIPPWHIMPTLGIDVYVDRAAWPEAY